MAPYIYPKIRRGDLVENLHGYEVPDPYRWLEDPDSDETKVRKYGRKRALIYTVNNGRAY